MKDVGVTVQVVQSNLKFTNHCTEVGKKAYFVTRNIFTTLNTIMMFFICKCIQPMFVLEYASQVRSPVLKLNIDLSENVQRYYARRILRRDNLSYLDRINHLELEILEHNKR